ncbi:MAG TPA: universal stress protein [Rubrivivax sp.]|nr:universal stress protein [Pseudomonadota bacterium]HOW49601.1 universal stress protein [Rubrivivax sp.]HRY88393.1 universal stress protein [Rubrivivax sp.]HRZ61023.1 universal stress protein [Rubrivivax sp.]
MYTRILVPVDGSSFSEQLVEPASQIAGAGGAELALMRVVERPDDMAQGERYVQALAGPFGAKSLCVPMPADGAAAAIVDEAQRVPGTLVAICSHGRSGAMQALFGSVALQVLRSLGEPAVVFRPYTDGPSAPAKVARVVLPLDGSEVSEAIVPQAAGLAKWLGARLVVVSVLEPSARPDPGIPASDVQESNYVRGKARDIAEKYGVQIGWEVLHGDPKEAIPRFVRSLGDAMLAMTTHGRTGLRGVITGSVTAQCLREARVPVYTRVP